MNIDVLGLEPHGESVIDISAAETEKEKQLLLEWLNSYDYE